VLAGRLQRIAADSKFIFDHLTMLFETETFDMDHLVPWLLEIVQPG
jgi:hypothetical protein